MSVKASKLIGTLMLAGALGGMSLSCSNELSREGSPVALVVSSTQTLQVIDLAGDPIGEDVCDQPVGEIKMEAVLKNPIGGTIGNPSSPGSTPVSSAFTRIRVSSYRVSYVRTDGGRTVPAPFVRSTDALIGVGEPALGLSQFTLLETGATLQAPFVSLLPINGGRDPETNRPFIRMNVIVEIFGETLAGERVSGSTVFPIDFCFACGGCAPKT